MEAGGSRYMLSTVLGVTDGGDRGNTAQEILRYLEASPKADGASPTGTIYFMDSGEIRSTTRAPGFHMAVEQLKLLKVAAQIDKGEIPKNKADVQGLLCGVANFDWNSSHSTIRPGAICENLTSFSGVFTPGFPQTTLAEFMKNGAAGSSGTVAEPFAIQNKFPYASVQVHYARGCSLAEAFYQSVYAPYQLIVVGDPLCQPWANIPAFWSTARKPAMCSKAKFRSVHRPRCRAADRSIASSCMSMASVGFRKRRRAIGAGYPGFSRRRSRAARGGN